MQALRLPKKTNTTEKPWRNEPGMVKGYREATIVDSFTFYGKDISAERYRFYMSMVKTRNHKSEIRNKKGRGVINSGKVETEELNKQQRTGRGGHGAAESD